jgi:hypothetical protein
LQLYIGEPIFEAEKPMSKQDEQLAGLITYCRDAVGDGYPFEVTDEDAKLVLEALELLQRERAKPSTAEG